MQIETSVSLSQKSKVCQLSSHVNWRRAITHCSPACFPDILSWETVLIRPTVTLVTGACSRSGCSYHAAIGCNSLLGGLAAGLVLLAEQSEIQRLWSYPVAMRVLCWSPSERKNVDENKFLVISTPLPGAWLAQGSWRSLSNLIYSWSSWANAPSPEKNTQNSLMFFSWRSAKIFL